MKNNRRDFLRLTGLGGLGLVSGGLMSFKSEEDQIRDLIGVPQHFNMSGYAAPKLETVRIGFIGLGMRGPGAVNRMSKIEGVEIKAICDLREKEVQKIQKMLADTPHNPETYSGSEEIWKEMVDREDLDLIYIATPWEWHTPMAVYAMEAGKHTAVEVPAAKTIDECWQLVE